MPCRENRRPGLQLCVDAVTIDEATGLSIEETERCCPPGREELQVQVGALDDDDQAELARLLLHRVQMALWDD